MVNRRSSKSLLAAMCIALAAVAAWPALNVEAFGQRGVARGSGLSPADVEMESKGKHDLEVARWYMDKRKAYSGARDRLKDIVDTYPEFSRVHEALFYLGEADEKLGNTDEAASCYRKLIKDFPGSEFVKKAKDRLSEMKLAEDGPTYKPSPPATEDKADTKPKEAPGRPTLRAKPSPSPPSGGSLL